MLCMEPHRLSVLALFLFSIAVFYFIVVVLPSSDESMETAVVCDTGCRAVDSLRLITVVSRHGNRGGMDYPKDPYPSSNKEYWPYAPSELTPYGRVQMYNLGVKIRSLYSGFLPDMYYPEDLRASSTSMDRLLMSGEAFLAGLYPPQGFQVWSPGLNWQPIPLYSDSPDKTPVIMKCPRYLEDALKSVLNITHTYSAMLNIISKRIMDATGINRTGNFVEIFAMCDKLNSEITEGFTIPEWTNEIYPNPLQDIVTEQYKSAFGGTDIITRLLIGELLDQMLDYMKLKVNGSLTPNRKMFYYSGHDSSIIALQRVLGVPWESMVGMVRPASALVIELHQNKTTLQYYLQILYLDGASDDQKVLQLPDNSFSTALKNSAKFTNINFTTECMDPAFHLPELNTDFPTTIFGGSFFYMV